MRRLFIIGIAAAFVLALQPAHAGPQTRTYVGAFGRLIVTPPLPLNTAIGGYSFTVVTGDPATLAVADVTGPGTAVVVCQEAGVVEDTPGSCEDGQAGQLPGDDVVQKLCATGEPQQLDPRFRAGAGNISVFVYAVDYTLREPACPGVGTTGTITLTH